MRLRGTLCTVTLLVVTVASSCDARDSDPRAERAASPASTTTTSEVEAGADGVMAGDAAANTTTTRPARTTSTTATRSERTTASTREQEKGATVLTYREFFERRHELVGDEVDVRGRVLFVTDCPPPDGGGPATCVSTAYLADEAKTGIPAYEQDQAVPLHRDGRAVACDGPGGRDFECGGFRHGVVYVVSGRPTRLVLGGKPSDRIVLEVANHRPD